MKINGDGYNNGYGIGYGIGYGNGYGKGIGNGIGIGNGDGDGYGYGDGYGNGTPATLYRMTPFTYLTFRGRPHVRAFDNFMFHLQVEQLVHRRV